MPRPKKIIEKKEVIEKVEKPKGEKPKQTFVGSKPKETKNVTMVDDIKKK